ncbi:hypothetical protein [Geminicoccus roseus]|uniref:hypothetical protein n=1 Tax=Geminicoccus roseus TaxID=404900 RepID=UPI000418F64C|nr:hypothetical protein [Geminicoccus roseus]
MSTPWRYQLRIDLSEELAAVARHNPDDPSLRPLKEILRQHEARLTCQYDAFAAYVAEAERHGTAGYPLYRWTRATIEDPAKRAKYLKSFTVYVDGQETYSSDQADALEAELRPLVGQTIARLARHDTNPENNPQPPAQYRS